MDNVSNPSDPIPNAPVSRDTKVWILVYIFGLVFLQGLVVNHLSVLLPVLKDALQLDDVAIGKTASFAFAAGMPALFLSGYVTEWIRPKLSGVFAVVSMGSGCIVMGTATSHVGVIVGIMITHFGLGWVLSIHSAVIANVFPKSRQRLFFLVMAMLAVGAIFGPPLIGEALNRVAPTAWGTVYVWLGIALWGLIGVLLLVCGRRIAHLGYQAGAAERRGRSSPAQSEQNVAERIAQTLASGVFNRPALYLLGLIVVLDNLASMNVFSWLGIMVTNRFSARPHEIGYLTSTMAMGVLVGRIFMAAFVSGRISDRKLLGYSYGLAMLLFMAMLFAPSMNMVYALYFMMSFFMSAQSAATYAIGAAKLKERAAVGIPIADGIGALGSLAAPLVMGYLAKQVSLDRALWLIPVFGFMLTFVCLAWEWIEKRIQRDDQGEAKYKAHVEMNK